MMLFFFFKTNTDSHTGHFSKQTQKNTLLYNEQLSLLHSLLSRLQQIILPLIFPDPTDEFAQNIGVET